MRWLVLCSIILVVGCTQKLANYDYDPQLDFNELKQYAVQQSDKQNYQSLDSSRIESAINSAMVGRYTKADASEADFIVAYYLEEERKIDQSGVTFGFGFGTGNVGVGVTKGPEAKEIIEGKLVLDVIESRHQQVIWKARSSKNLRQSMSPEQRSTLISELITEMLANFPP